MHRKNSPWSSSVLYVTNTRMSTLRQKFAERLQEIRKQKGISQQQLSRQAGFDRTYVGKIEREGKSPSLDAIERIAEELDVEVIELFDFENNKDNQ